MYKEVEHVYNGILLNYNNGILLNHKMNELMLLAATWMDLEIIIRSEVSQRKRNIV